MDQKARKSLPEPTTKTSSIVHPCFSCGLIFAKREEFLQHMERYHQPKSGNGQKDGFRCHECPQVFADDEKAFKEHLLVHDMLKIFGALRRSEMARKRVQPLFVPAPPADTTASKSMETSVWDQEGKITATFGGQVGSSKGKSNRPRSKSVFNNPNVRASQITAAVSSPQTRAPPATPTEPGRKRRRVCNGASAAVQATPVHATVDPVATSSPSILRPQSPTPTTTTPQAAEPAPATTTEQAAPSPSTGAPSAPPPSAAPPAAQVQSPSSNIQRIMPALQSACPNCNQNLGKPWHLVDHMIQQHDAQLLRLHRTLKKPDGASGTVVVSQMFSDRQCPFCQLMYPDMQTALLHVIRTHRSRLFECPDNGECVLTCELMCAIGPDASQKKFTISVKVKRKSNE